MPIKRRHLVACFAALAGVGSAWAAGGFHLLRSVTIGGDTFWDCVTFDAANRHLFIAHGTHVVVLDSNSYAVVGDIPDTPGVHDVAVAGPLDRGFISAGGSNSVVVFDLRTLATTGTIAVGTRPDALLFDPHTQRVLAFNAGSRDATVIDARSGAVVGTVPLGGKPEFAVTDARGRVFANIEDTAEIAEIDAAQFRVVRRWPLAPCTGPSGLAIDTAHARLFVACGNEMMAAVDANTGRVVATVPTGKGADGAGFDPGTGEVLIPNGEGRLTVIHEDTPDRYRLVANVPTEHGARTMDYDPATHRLFTVTADLTPDPGKHPPYQVGPGSFRLLVYGR